MANNDTEKKYNPASWFEDAGDEMKSLMPLEGPAALSLLESASDDALLEHSEEVCDACFEAIKIPGKDLLSNPSKAFRLIRAALNVLKNPMHSHPRTRSFISAAAIIFSACQPGNVLSNTKPGHQITEKYSSVEELASASSQDISNIVDTISANVADSNLAEPMSKAPKYPAGTTITIPFTELGKVASEFSTNESIKTFRQLDSIAHIEGCDKDYLSQIKIVVNIIDPADSTAYAKIKQHRSSTAYTDGLYMDHGAPVITISSIPIPDTASLANLLSHEIKHPFPQIAANILHTRPEYRNRKPLIPAESENEFRDKLDGSETINKAKTGWNVDGMRLDPLKAALDTKCITLPTQKDKSAK